MDLITKNHALSAGLQFYFTGKSCKRGHIAERRVSSSVCVQCERIANEAKKPAIRERKRAKYAADPDAARKRNREYREANKDRLSATARQRYALDPEPAKAAAKDYRERKKRELQERRKTDEHREKSRIRASVRRSCAKYRINAAMRTRLSKSLKVAGIKKDGRLYELVGYTRDELIAHLEAQFTKGMGWHNFGEWHIDHIVPLVTFSFIDTSDGEFVAAWSLSNLRPIWSEENHAKGSKALFLL